jgi:hypothetical protein
VVEIDVVHRLSRELCSAARQAEAGDPDAPAWEAEVRARQLLAGIATMTVLRPGRAEDQPGGAARPRRESARP